MKYIIVCFFVFLSFGISLSQSHALEGIKVENNKLSSDGTVPAGVGGVEVLSFDIVAGPRDVEVFSLYLKRRGLSDGDTISGVSAFSNGYKITDTQDENNGNDDEVELQIADEFIVPSGTRKTVSIVANVSSLDDAPNVSNNEFSFDLILIRSPQGSQRLQGIRGRTLRVGGVDVAAPIFRPDDPINRISLSKKNRIFEFDLEAPEDSDVEIQGIRLRSTYDELDNDFEDIILALDNKILANGKRNDEYITFFFQKPLVLTEGNRETFTIAARVKSRVDEELSFFLDGREDLIFTDLNQGSSSGYYQKSKISKLQGQEVIEKTEETQELTDEGIVIEPRVSRVVEKYIRAVEAQYPGVDERIKKMSDTIIRLQLLASERFELRDTISAVVYLLRKQSDIYRESAL